MRTLISPVPIRIALYGVGGRLVRRIFEGAGSSGLTGLRWNCSMVPPGAYVVRMDAEDAVAQRKIVVLR